jgi:predicted phosphodiesterase
VAEPILRILSDLHYGERSSRIGTLAQIRPLLEGAGSVLLNGDTLDTRPGPDPEGTARCLAEVRAFFEAEGLPARFITGNHDPNLPAEHWADLAGGRVFVAHGDILFPDIVPWGQDSPMILKLMREELAVVPDVDMMDLDARFGIIRRVAAAVPQRHQVERHPIKFALRFAKDTIWPPTRILRVLRAWAEVPARAEALLARHRPGARFFIFGHTHRPGIWRLPSGRVLVNTGAFCWPSGSLAVDVGAGRLVVRRVVKRAGAYHLGPALAEHPLAA